jgi:hypothetical protein
MKKLVLMVLGLLVLPSFAFAVEDCYTCVLGLFDEEQLVHNTGTIAADPGSQKDIYLGIKFTEPQTGLTGIEFSVFGIEQSGLLLLSSDALIPEALRIGAISAPTDTSAATTLDGGSSINWASCLGGTQALLRISLLALGPVTSDTVFEVKRKYPTTDPTWHTPAFFKCDGPNFTTVRVTGSCYVLNPSGSAVPGCSVAVAPQSWTHIKGLFR